MAAAADGLVRDEDFGHAAKVARDGDGRVAAVRYAEQRIGRLRLRARAAFEPHLKDVARGRLAHAAHDQFAAPAALDEHRVRAAFARGKHGGAHADRGTRAAAEREY